MKRKIYLILAALCVLNVQAFAGLGSGREGNENGKAANRMSAPAMEQHEMQAESPAAVQADMAVEEAAPAPVAETAVEMPSKKEMRRDLRSAAKEFRKVRRAQKPQDDTQILAIIVAIFLPFVGVAIWEGGITMHFWIDLILTLLFYLPGLIYALYIILAT